MNRRDQIARQCINIKVLATSISGAGIETSLRSGVRAPPAHSPRRFLHDSITREIGLFRMPSDCGGVGWGRGRGEGFRTRIQADTRVVKPITSDTGLSYYSPLRLWLRSLHANLANASATLVPSKQTPNLISKHCSQHFSIKKNGHNNSPVYHQGRIQEYEADAAVLSAVSPEAGNSGPKPSISLGDKPTQGANVVSVSLRLAHSITFGSVCELGNYTPAEEEEEEESVCLHHLPRSVIGTVRGQAGLLEERCWKSCAPAFDDGVRCV